VSSAPQQVVIIYVSTGNFQLSVLFAYRQLVSDSYYQLFHEKSRNCADAYIISIASSVDILHVDYAKQTYPVLPLTEWQYE